MYTPASPPRGCCCVPDYLTLIFLSLLRIFMVSLAAGVRGFFMSLGETKDDAPGL
jgi:hypothetical protein